MELLKQVATVMGASGCFGMVLHAKSSMFAVPNTGNRVVIEIAVRDFQMIRQGLFFDGKTIHGSYNNQTADRWRRSFICHYVGQNGASFQPAAGTHVSQV